MSDDDTVPAFAEQLHSSVAGRLVEAMPEPAVVVDAEGRAIVANKPAFALLPGLKLGEPLSSRCARPTSSTRSRRVLATGEAETAPWSERVPVERLFEVCVAPLEAAAGAVAAALLSLRDLTEQRRLERMRVDFVANASHELRTPLASLLGFIETLQGSAHDDAKARDKFLAIMREQARRMARLIDDLLSLSRIEQKQHVRPRRGGRSRRSSSRHVADTLAPLAARDAGSRSKLDADRPVIVPGDRDELLRVAENLIENAIKYGARQDGASADRVEIAVDAHGARGLACRCATWAAASRPSICRA